jgi:hypothetical protein
VQTPALFADGIGEISQEEMGRLSTERIILPAMNQADIDAFIASGGQQVRAPPPRPPPSSAAAARGPLPPATEPIYAPGMPSEPANEVEAAWMSLFLENHLWVDQRATVSTALLPSVCGASSLLRSRLFCVLCCGMVC